MQLRPATVKETQSTKVTPAGPLWCPGVPYDNINLFTIEKCLSFHIMVYSLYLFLSQLTQYCGKQHGGRDRKQLPAFVWCLLQPLRFNVCLLMMLFWKGLWVHLVVMVSVINDEQHTWLTCCRENAVAGKKHPKHELCCFSNFIEHPADEESQQRRHRDRCVCVCLVMRHSAGQSQTLLTHFTT